MIGFDVLADIAGQLGEDDIVADVDALRRRLDEGRFFVACVGQFKRGKSTLINALVGDAILPVGVIPVTAVVTIVRYGENRRVRVCTRCAEWREVEREELASYVAEEQNPDNMKQVVAIEVYEPSALLMSGMCLVDTPGLGSIHTSNTAATHAFLPHVDAALVVLGADPPISGDELMLVEEVARETPRLVFVINKADRLCETDVAQARSFTARVLGERIGRACPEVLVVSATERQLQGATRDWSALEANLATFARDGGVDLVEAARRRGLARLSARVAHSIAEHRAALERPLEESRRRLEAMTRAVDDAARTLMHLEYLFRAEEEASRRVLDARRATFLREASPAAATELLARLQASSGADVPGTHAFDVARSIARERLEAWARSVQPEAEELYRRATDRFVTHGNDFLQRLLSTGDETFAALPSELPPEAGFRTASHFFFTDMLTLAEPVIAPGLLDMLRTRARAIRAAHRQTMPYLERLLETNSARLTNDLVDRVPESGRHLRMELASMLRALTTTAQRAIEYANASRANGDARVQTEIDRLGSLERRLAHAH